jgi:hypothetical protein
VKSKSTDIATDMVEKSTDISDMPTDINSKEAAVIDYLRKNNFLTLFEGNYYE